MRADPRALLLLLPALAGCSTVCRGPGCESAYDASRLSVFYWSADRPRSLDPIDDADHVIRGTALEGVNWVVRPGPNGSVWIGMPDANQVMRVPALGKLSPDLVISGSGRFGATLELLDLDGDGFRELVVGAPDFELASGAVYLFSDIAGRTGSLDTSDAELTILGTSYSDHLGTRITPCADLTGDTLPEMILSAPWIVPPPGSGLDQGDTPMEELAGGVFLVRSEALAGRSGTASPFDLGPLWYGQGEGDAAGHAVACRDDLTGDRRADVAIGAPYADNGDTQTNNGIVYLIETDGTAAEAGQPSLPDTGRLDVVATDTLNTETEDAFFGSSLITLELDRESPVDLVVGAPGASTGQGLVEVFRGLDLFLATDLPWRVIRNEDGRTEPDHFGTVLRAADLDGDGVEDLMAGVPDWFTEPNAYDAGRLFIWSGGAAQSWPPIFTVDSASWAVEGTEPFQRVGERMTTMDLDGDGVRDLMLPTRTVAPAAN